MPAAFWMGFSERKGAGRRGGFAGTGRRPPPTPYPRRARTRSTRSARRIGIRSRRNPDRIGRSEVLHVPNAPSHPRATIYVAGLLAMGYTEFYTFLIPLYGLSLGLKAGEIGMLVGARSLLAVFLSIHIGTLMDRFGTRRVTLFFVWTAMALAPVFPLIPWFWPLLALQIINGGALSFAWSGSQTLIAQLAEGEAEYIGRFSFFARIGSTVAPLLVGIAWDCGGAWPSYMLGFAWGVVLTIALLRAPEAEIAPRGGAVAARPARVRARDARPRLPDYVRCFALMAS